MVWFLGTTPRRRPATRIEAIVIEGRHRKDFRDLDSLAASIKELGVLQPVLVTPDLRLIAGERRIRAAKSLGMETIPTRVVSHLSEAADLLKAERDENTCRQEMTISEKVSLARQIEELEKPAAAERMAATLMRGTEPPLGSAEPSGGTRRSAEIAGEAVGMSRITYQRAKYVMDTADDETEDPEVREVAQKAAEQMDRGEAGEIGSKTNNSGRASGDYTRTVGGEEQTVRVDLPNAKNGSRAVRSYF